MSAAMASVIAGPWDWLVLMRVMLMSVLDVGVIAGVLLSKICFAPSVPVLKNGAFAAFLSSIERGLGNFTCN